MRVGALVSNGELGRGLVVENTGSGWKVHWYEKGRANKLMKIETLKSKISIIL